MKLYLFNNIKLLFLKLSFQYVSVVNGLFFFTQHRKYALHMMLSEPVAFNLTNQMNKWSKWRQKWLTFFSAGFLSGSVLLLWGVCEEQQDCEQKTAVSESHGEVWRTRTDLCFSVQLTQENCCKLTAVALHPERRRDVLTHLTSQTHTHTHTLSSSVLRLKAHD